MTETAYEWLIVLLFFLLAVGLLPLDALWLSRKGWAGFGKALGFSALSNITGFALGFFLLFLAGLGFMMLAFENPFKTESQSNYAMGAILFFIVMIVPVLLILCKRIFLRLFKIQSGKSAWLYAIISSMLIFLISFGIPAMIGFFLYR